MEELSELAQLARRCAELDIASDPEPLLRGYGLSKEAWLELQERFLAQIADDLDRGETERANLFSATYEHRRGELLGAEQIANDNGAHLVADAAQLAAVPSLPAPRAAGPQLASFQQPAAGATAAGPDPDATAMVDACAVQASVQTKAVPFDLNAGPLPLPPVKEITEAQSGETQLTPTLDLATVLASRGIGLGPSSSPQPIAPVAVPIAAPKVDATEEIDTRQLTALLQAKGILPFDKDAPSAPPVPSPPQDQSGQTGLTPQLDLEALRRAADKAKNK